MERFPVVLLAQLSVCMELAELAECALVFIYILTIGTICVEEALSILRLRMKV